MTKVCCFLAEYIRENPKIRNSCTEKGEGAKMTLTERHSHVSED